MALKLVLFDFHFTLANCICQLDVEVSSLPRRLLDKLQRYQDSLPSLEHWAWAYERAEDVYTGMRAEMRAINRSMLLVDRAVIILNTLGLSITRDQTESLVAEVMKDCLSEITAVTGAAETLQHLSSAGYKLGVVSSTGYPPSVEDGLAFLGFLPYIDRIITTGSVGVPKSDPKLYIHATSLFDVPPHEAVHIGDDPVNDVTSAKAAGLRTIWYTGLIKESAKFFGRVPENDQLIGSQAEATTSNMLTISSIVDRLSTEPRMPGIRNV
jgi:HAD superfamily hydrolase (TIGR01549 family)